MARQFLLLTLLPMMVLARSETEGTLRPKAPSNSLDRSFRPFKFLATNRIKDSRVLCRQYLVDLLDLICINSSPNGKKFYRNFFNFKKSNCFLKIN